jgi:hypothetical protein
MTLPEWLAEAEAAWWLLDRSGQQSAVELRLERDRGGIMRARIKTEGVPIPTMRALTNGTNGVDS